MCAYKDGYKHMDLYTHTYIYNKVFTVPQGEAGPKFFSPKLTSRIPAGSSPAV